MATAYPETHERLRPRVLPYTRAFFDIDSPEIVWTLYLFRFFLSLLLVVVSVNVAILVYARTATRAGEIAVRTALGASRARVVTQLFVEALVLSVTAALVGLAIAGVALAKLQALGEGAVAERRLGALPFWLDLGLSPAVIIYALVLAILGAVIVGVVPALQATGRRVQAGLQQFSGHGARMQLGRAWTVLIIAQVAVAVAVLPFALHFTEEASADGIRDAGYPAEEFLEASLAMERADGPQDTSATSQRAMEQRFSARAAELIRRLESDPAVAGLTIQPPLGHERVEVEDIASPGADRRRIAAGSGRIYRVTADFFALYGMPILAGRAFAEADARAGTTAVIVNEVFAEKRLGNGPVLGRRLRFVRETDTPGEAEAGPWLEIVGVVRDFEGYKHEPLRKLYLPADAAQLSPPINLAIRVRASPATSFVPRLRDLAAAVDPALQLDGVISAAERHTQTQQVARYLAIGTTAAMLSALLLSAAGIYAMMSFTVARRRREIGIRSALGADPRRVLSSIFARASAQISAGILLGVIGTVALDRVAGRGPVHDGNPVALLLVAALMSTVGLVAAIGPARRGLAIQPTEALREE
jgi:predicted permease